MFFCEELYNSIKIPRPILYGEILYYSFLVLISVVLFVILMVIRGQRKVTVYNKDEKEDEFFVLSEPDYSCWVLF